MRDGPRGESAGKRGTDPNMRKAPARTEVRAGASPTPWCRVRRSNAGSKAYLNASSNDIPKQTSTSQAIAIMSINGSTSTYMLGCVWSTTTIFIAFIETRRPSSGSERIREYL